MTRFNDGTEKVDAERALFLSRQQAEVLKCSPALLPLHERLLSIGGTWTILPVIEEDLSSLMRRGEVMRGRALMRAGQQSRCHENSANLWDANKGVLEICTGYAMSKDKIWRQHSWCWWPSRRKIVETTLRRLLYYGFRLTPKEAEAFWEDNAL